MNTDHGDPAREHRDKAAGDATAAMTSAELCRYHDVTMGKLVRIYDLAMKERDQARAEITQLTSQRDLAWARIDAIRGGISNLPHSMEIHALVFQPVAGYTARGTDERG